MTFNVNLFFFNVINSWEESGYFSFAFLLILILILMSSLLLPFVRMVLYSFSVADRVIVPWTT